MLQDLTASSFEQQRVGYQQFLKRCAGGRSGEYSLTPLAEPSIYAMCFAIYGWHLLGAHADSAEKRATADRVREVLRQQRGSGGPPQGKPYRQLLSFGLSALAILGELDRDPLEDLVSEQLPHDLSKTLTALGCLGGEPGSGNQAMFIAIFLLHARDRLGLKTQERIDDWVALHLAHMNCYGFWGPKRGMTHLQFQNGYHQYEILEYLGVDNPRSAQAVAAVRGLADWQGHFAPYPGGGGCYDYDAVFVLTPSGKVPDGATRTLLERTAETLISEQRLDGGFAESLYVRPRSLANIGRFARQLTGAVGSWPLLFERLRYCLTLQRPKHDRIHTHWSRYSRRWDESDLWDSWFRMLTLARIQVALDPSKAAEWGFIDYPGIGFHPAVRDRAAKS